MRRIAAALLAFFALTGFGAPPYDLAAVSRAQTARQKAVAACRAESDGKSLSDVMACVLAADNQFAAAIGFQDYGVLEQFSTGVAALKTDNDKGKIVGLDAARRFTALEDDFFKALRMSYDNYEAEQARQYARDSADAAERDRMSMQRMDSMNGMNGMMGN